VDTELSVVPAMRIHMNIYFALNETKMIGSLVVGNPLLHPLSSCQAF